jgi:hypothetical protein
MRKTSYRAVVAAGVAAVLAGVVFFSPLLCGMTCLEVRGARPDVAGEFAPTVEELAGEFVGSAVVGCALTHVVLNVDLSAWGDVFAGGTWIWVGVEAVGVDWGDWKRMLELIGRRGKGIL